MTACYSRERFPELCYGKGTVQLDLSEAESVSYLYGSDMPTIADLKAEFRRSRGRMRGRAAEGADPHR